MRIRDLSRFLLLVAVCGPLATRGEAQEGPARDRGEAAIANLRAESVDVRRNAANVLRLSDKNLQRKALPVLIDRLMNEKDGQVRLAVLDAVTALGPEASAAVPALVHTLRTNYGGQGKEESHQDYRSALALAAVGQPAVEGLRGLLKERKESVRAEVVMGLGRIGPDAERAVPDLIPLLGDRSDRIRREASRALGRIGAAAVGALIDASSNQDVGIRAQAVESFGLLTSWDDQVRQTVLKCTQDEAPAVRSAAVGALARTDLSDEFVAPSLGENLRHPDESVRLAAVNGLVRRKALLVRMAPELESLLTAELEGVSRLAAFLLGKIGPDAAPRLLNGLRQAGSRIDPIAAALAQIGPPVVPLMISAIDDPEPRVRRGAALALGRIRPLGSGIVPQLTRGLGDADPDVRAAVLTAVRDIGPRAREAVPAVRALLLDKSAEVRLQVIAILAQSAPRDDQLLTDLAGLVNDADTRVQRQAIDLLRSLGPIGRKSISVVIGKFSSDDPEVRFAATEMVRSHGQAASEAVPGLCALLDDPAPKVRTNAIRTLGGLGKQAQPAFDRLTTLVRDAQAEVREAAALTMGGLELDPKVIRPHLAQALGDEKPEVRRSAAKAIQRLGPQGAIFLPDVILFAGSKANQRSAERLLRPFERTGPDASSLPELVKQLEHDQETVRLLAIKFLGLAGRNASDAIPALERLRDDPSVEVRKQAEAACEHIKNLATSG